MLFCTKDFEKALEVSILVPLNCTTEIPVMTFAFSKYMSVSHMKMLGSLVCISFFGLGMQSCVSESGSSSDGIAGSVIVVNPSAKAKVYLYAGNSTTPLDSQELGADGRFRFDLKEGSEGTWTVWAQEEDQFAGFVTDLKSGDSTKIVVDSVSWVRLQVQPGKIEGIGHWGRGSQAADTVWWVPGLKGVNLPIEWRQGQVTRVGLSVGQIAPQLVQADALTPVSLQSVRTDGSIELTDSLVDPRDGQRYGVVVLGSQQWMTQSLDYEVPTKSRCLGQDCLTSERVYASNVGKVCPDGWSMPTEKVWNDLLGRYTDEQEALRALASPLWGADKTNQSKLGISPLGYLYDDKLVSVGFATMIWIEAPLGSELNQVMKVHPDSFGITTVDSKHWVSVRCMRSL